MLTRFSLTAALAFTPMFATAEAHQDDVTALFEAMNLPQIIEIMREEGLDYGNQIAGDLFPDRNSPDWPDTVSNIYDYDLMRDGLALQIGAELADSDSDIASMTAFFQTETGQLIVDMEVAARRALMDEDIEDASKDAAAIAIADEAPRVALIERFVDANDLVETNVVGAMNANYAFYLGLLDGGAFPQELSQDQILSDVWSQEAEIRSNTTEWVYSYLLLAYQPLTDAQIETYITFSESDDGQALNTAMFVAFDSMFNSISRGLGLAASEFMVGQDL